MQRSFQLLFIFILAFQAGDSFAYSTFPRDRDSVKKQSTDSRPILSQGRKYITGPRGGCYYINKNGNKTYVDRSYCNGTSVAAQEVVSAGSSAVPASKNYIRGSKGGCYYINKSGRKVYVGREMCE